MNEKYKKQHYIPNFYLKWILCFNKNNNLKIFQKNTKEQRWMENKYNNPFFKNNLYKCSFKNNSNLIEKHFSKLENDFSIILHSNFTEISIYDKIQILLWWDKELYFRDPDILGYLSIISSENKNLDETYEYINKKPKTNKKYLGDTWLKQAQMKLDKAKCEVMGHYVNRKVTLMKFKNDMPVLLSPKLAIIINDDTERKECPIIIQNTCKEWFLLENKNSVEYLFPINYNKINKNNIVEKNIEGKIVQYKEWIVSKDIEDKIRFAILSSKRTHISNNELKGKENEYCFLDENKTRTFNKTKNRFYILLKDSTELKIKNNFWNIIQNNINLNHEIKETFHLTSKGEEIMDKLNSLKFQIT